MGRLSQTFKICLALLFAVLSTNLLPVYASALTAPVYSDENVLSGDDEVNICHSQASVTGGSNTNPYVAQSPNFNGVLNGHADIHNIEKIWFDGTTEGWGDIVPPFYYKKGNDTLQFTGLNWTAEGQAIYANDCEIETSADPETPAVPTVNAITKCGTYGSVVLPEDSEKITYSVTPTNPSEGKFTVTANPAKDVELDVTGTSYTLGQNGKATYEGDLGEYSRCPVISTLVECESFELIEATNNDLKGWTLVKGASFVDGGIKLSSPGDWTSAKISRSMTGTLADLGTGIGYNPDTLYLGLHVQTADGTLVYETAYGGNWWLDEDTATANMKSNAPHTGGGQGSNYYGTLQEWATAFPELQVQKLTVLYTSPTPASTTVTSVKIGCNEYTFDYERLVQACTVRDNTYRDTWMFDGYTYPESDDYSGVVNNATFQFTNEGLHISTPDKPSYVFGLIDGGNTPLADVDAMSYKTFRKDMSAGYDQTVPAYILYVDTNGDAPNGETYFFYEPYNNGAVVEGAWQTWDAINSGNAKWWMSGTGQKLQSWSYFVGQFPDAVVLAYGFNQGTSNAETYAIIQDMKFDCAITNFAAPQVLGEETTNPTPTGPTVIVPTTGAVLPAQIPATGGDNSNQIAMLVAIIVGGLTYFLVLRRQQSYEL